MKAIYINPTEHFEAIVAGEPQALVSIAVWSDERARGKYHDRHVTSVTISYETTQGEEPNDSSRFTVCVPDARELLEAIRRAIES